MMALSFWNRRKVFVTGHTGFKGGWLALWLDSLGAEVTGYGLSAPTQPNLFTQARVSESVASIIGDIRDYAKLKSALAEARPEIVLHMAAQSVVKRGYEDPLETYSTNVMGTVNLLFALQELKLDCVVVNVTTDKCYQNKEWVWGYRETDRLGGHDPYSNSKACAELVASSFDHSYFSACPPSGQNVRIASARAGNVVGGGDWTPNQLVPDLIRSFRDEPPCMIRNPGAIRPWQFVLEPLRGYLAIAEGLHSGRVESGSAWNLGPVDSDAICVAELADGLCERWGDNAAWSKDESEHAAESMTLRLDISKSRAELDWRPCVSISQTLDWTTEWYRTCLAGGDMRSATLKQVKAYEGCCLGAPGGARS